MDDAVAESAQTLGERAGESVHAPRNLRESFRPVVDGIHARHYGQQHLRRADVARRLFAADVLLSRLQCHPQSRLSIGVARNADYASGKVPLEFVLRREVRSVRPAVAERNTEPLGISDGDVGAPLSRRCEQDETEKIGGNRHQRVGGVQLIDCFGVIDHGAVSRRVLHESAEDFGPDLEIGVTRHAHLNAAHAGAGFHHVDRLRMAL